MESINQIIKKTGTSFKVTVFLFGDYVSDWIAKEHRLSNHLPGSKRGGSTPAGIGEI